MTRNLQAIATGAGITDQFVILVQAELEQYGIDYPIHLKHSDVLTLAAQFNDLVRDWRALREGEGLELDFPIENWS